jgi:PST family polysaccharide transporter
VLGVAIGYASAGFLLTPVLMIIQRRLAGVTIRKQHRSILPAVHASLWGCAGYLTLRHFESDHLLALLGGFGVYLGAAGAVLWIVHRAALRRTAEVGASILGLRSRDRVGAAGK